MTRRRRKRLEGPAARIRCRMAEVGRFGGYWRRRGRTFEGHGDKEGVHPGHGDKETHQKSPFIFVIVVMKTRLCCNVVQLLNHRRDTPLDVAQGTPDALHPCRTTVVHAGRTTSTPFEPWPSERPIARPLLRRRNTPLLNP